MQDCNPPVLLQLYRRPRGGVQAVCLAPLLHGWAGGDHEQHGAHGLLDAATPRPALVGVVMPRSTKSYHTYFGATSRIGQAWSDGQFVQDPDGQAALAY